MTEMASNPFTPGSGLYPPYFAGRKREEDIFKKNIKQTIAGTPMHMSIIGDWASGKTSLLKKFKETAEGEKCFVCKIVSPNTDSIAVFVNTISKSIADEIKLKEGMPFFKRVKSKVDKLTGIQAFGFGASIQKEDNLTPQFDLRIGLRTVWNELKEDYKGIVLFIDDLDTITESKTKRKQIILTLRNALMESIDDGVKVMCVVTGANLFEQFEVAHGPLVRFFEPLILGNLNDNEARDAILIPLESSGIKFDPDVIKRIIETTQGQPYYIQEFCYHLFENAINDKVTTAVYDASYDSIMHDIAAKVWNQKTRQLGDTNSKILHIISTGRNTTSQIEKHAGGNFGISAGAVRTALSRMQRENKVKKNGRGVYIMEDALFREYLKTIF
ncbi:MAG: hypothetical protein A7315_05750 [Candidatus Altiarchaeales archaeon WOR_SM1_79]|nr:MAG: hypothetical protein A7315_05750 [Candidatus Altiarchaeales archaeon WOR_SM1_79]